MVVPKAAKTMAGLAVEAAFSAPGALITEMSSSRDNHPNLLRFTMSFSFMRLLATKKILKSRRLKDCTQLLDP